MRPPLRYRIAQRIPAILDGLTQAVIMLTLAGFVVVFWVTLATLLYS